jgi:adenosine deaminase
MGQYLAGIIAGLTEGIEAAEAEVGVRCFLIADIDRSYGPGAGLELVEQLGELRASGRAERAIGIGADSTELGVDLRSFAPAFEAAKRFGFRRTCHAGEAVGVGPENVRIAVDVLGAERIDHGVAIAEDQALMRRAADERIPLTVCPTSNVVIANRYRSLAEHTLLVMRQAGLLVTINTDDPALEELDLGEEYRRVGEAFGLEFDALSKLAHDGIDSTWLDDSDRRQLAHEFEAVRPPSPAPTDRPHALER